MIRNPDFTDWQHFLFLSGDEIMVDLTIDGFLALMKSNTPFLAFFLFLPTFVFA